MGSTPGRRAEAPLFISPGVMRGTWYVVRISVYSYRCISSTLFLDLKTYFCFENYYTRNTKTTLHMFREVSLEKSQKKSLPTVASVACIIPGLGRTRVIRWVLICFFVLETHLHPWYSVIELEPYTKQLTDT